MNEDTHSPNWIKQTLFHQRIFQTLHIALATSPPAVAYHRPSEVYSGATAAKEQVVV